MSQDLKAMALAELARIGRELEHAQERLAHVHQLLELADTPELPGIENGETQRPDRDLAFLGGKRMTPPEHC